MSTPIAVVRHIRGHSSNHSIIYAYLGFNFASSGTAWSNKLPRPEAGSVCQFTVILWFTGRVSFATLLHLRRWPGTRADLDAEALFFMRHGKHANPSSHGPRVPRCLCEYYLYFNYTVICELEMRPPVIIHRMRWLFIFFSSTSAAHFCLYFPGWVIAASMIVPFPALSVVVLAFVIL